MIALGKAADYLAVSEMTVLRLKAVGGLPFVRVAGKTTRYRLEPLARWAESQERRNETPH